VNSADHKNRTPLKSITLVITLKLGQINKRDTFHTTDDGASTSLNDLIHDRDHTLFWSYLGALLTTLLRTAPHRTAPHRTAPHRTAPFPAAPSSVAWLG
jgi:hypothetical protein